MAEFESEEEFRGGRRFPIRGRGASSQPLRRPLLSPRRPLRPSLAGPKQPWSRPTRPPYRRPRVSWPIARVPGVYREPDGFEPEPTAGSEYVRWAQSCLNQILGLQLPVSGVMDPETRSAVRSFQREQQLRTTGVLGPETEDALRRACGAQREFNLELQPFEAYRNLDDEQEVKIVVDAPGWEHINKNLAERFNLADRNKILAKIRNLIGMPAPPEAVGIYEWYVQVGGLGDGTDHANIVAVGHMIRSVLKKDMVVRGTRYTIKKGKLKRWGVPTMGELEWGEAELPGLGEVNGELGFESLLSEAEEIELAAELLSLSSEDELDLFLGKFFKRIGSGLKKAGRFIGKRVLPVLGKGLKTLAKAALPIVGKVAGSFIPIPGVGTAIGGAIGTAVSNALELEFSGVTAEEAELEMARRFVQLAATAAQRAALSSPDSDAEVVVNEAIVTAARQHLPHFRLRKSERSGMPGRTQQGRWIRRDRHIVLLGA
ncbi:MAG: peptidoglycan-binding protein [Nitrospira sp.]